MESLEKRIDEWLMKIREQYVLDVIEAVSIPSISVNTEGKYPFGKECARMLDHMGKVLERYGFPYQNHEYYCASSVIEGRECLGEIGLFGHLDVVPAGEGWSCEPFEGHVDQGYIVGRGSSDNKGAAFACLYAMRFFQEQKISLKNNIRLMFGCNEEAGMEDAKYYVRNYPVPDVTIVPDSWWPVSCSEKGVFLLEVAALVDDGNLLEFATIGADNTVPNCCTCVLANIDISQIKALEKLNSEIRFEEMGNKTIRLTAYGIGAHASFPEGSRSAVKILLEFVLEHHLIYGKTKTVFEFMRDSVSDYEGRCMDIDFCDPFGGNTTNVLTKVEMKNKRLFFNYKICYPATEKIKKEEVNQRLKKYFKRDFLEITREKASGPHLVEKGHPIVDIFCKNASNVFGYEMKPFSQAGGTYAWEIPNAFAAGPSIHKRPQTLFQEEGHGGAHQPDECVEIEGLLKGIKIYILSLLEIDEWLSSEKKKDK